MFRATLVVLFIAVAPLGAEAPLFVCTPIAPGQSASDAAKRLTGNAAAAYSTRFQIRDPARRVFVPKSQYQRLRRHWEACVARVVAPRPAAPVPLPASSLQLPERAAPLTAAIPARPVPPDPTSDEAAPRTPIALAISLVVTLCASVLLVRYAPARSIPPDLQRAGEEFIAAFAGPLLDDAANGPPVIARLRFVPHAQRLEVWLAPNAGRRYPNLLDHQHNVIYDANRVLPLLSGHFVLGGRLRAEGKWVVVPIRRADRHQAGTT